jgi:phytoene dehydrogenase-like protein
MVAPALTGQSRGVPAAADAIVIGAGPNGLVAANLLADAGWDVLVLEAQPEPGGAVRSGEVAAPGFVSDRFSSFYPLAVGSPVLRDLRLEEHGLVWRHAPSVLAHPLPDGRTAVLSRDVDVTAASLDAFAPGDGDAWRRMVDEWRGLQPWLVEALMRPFPPVRPAAALLRHLGAADAVRFARFAMLSVRRLGAERFAGEGGPLLLAGNALHTDLAPDATASGIFGWLLVMLGQDVGFPVPEGGAGQLTAALVTRLRAAGGRLECDTRVTAIDVADARATGVRTSDGRRLTASRAVLADVTAPQLYLDLVGAEQLPARLVDDLRHFTWDDATVKVDWALSAPIPWQNEGVAGAGTVHLGGDLDDLTRFGHALALRKVPAKPFLLLGQMTTTDPSRSPAGTESAWAYTHVPRSAQWDKSAVRERFLERLESAVESFAPGFRDLPVGRHVQFPGDLEGHDANLVGGAVNGGSSSVHQQLVFRPTPGLGRAETPIAGLYLASASAHPGGGVHGACGANAARAALRARTTGRLALAVTRKLSGPAASA